MGVDVNSVNIGKLGIQAGQATEKQTSAISLSKIRACKDDGGWTHLFRVFFKEMLIYWLLPKISAQKKKRRFSFAYKPTTYVAGLAAHPWAARKR